MYNTIPFHSDCYNSFFRLPEEIIKKNESHPILNQFMLVSAGHKDTQHNIGHYVERYSKDEYIVIYCVEGEGWVKYENEIRTIQSGEIFFCHSDTLHHYGSHDERPWTIYWSCFRGDHVPYFLEFGGAGSFKPVLQIRDSYRLISLFSEILEILKNGYASIHLLYASGCLKLILNHLAIQMTYSENKTSSECIIENAITFMLENINTSLNLNIVSKNFNLSKDHFIRLFKKKIGFTPIDYFIRLKMQQACQLLSATNLTIKEIACRLGYIDIYHFSRIFKNKIGYSPKHYREKVKT